MSDIQKLFTFTIEYGRYYGNSKRVVSEVLTERGFEGFALSLIDGFWRGWYAPAMKVEIVAYASDRERIISAVQLLCREFKEDSAIFYEIDLAAESLSVTAPFVGPALPEPETFANGDGTYTPRVVKNYDSPASGYRPAHGGYPDDRTVEGVPYD